jgi:hypothetical protein
MCAEAGHVCRPGLAGHVCRKMNTRKHVNVHTRCDFRNVCVYVWVYIRLHTCIPEGSSWTCAFYSFEHASDTLPVCVGVWVCMYPWHVCVHRCINEYIYECMNENGVRVYVFKCLIVFADVASIWIRTCNTYLNCHACVGVPLALNILGEMLSGWRCASMYAWCVCVCSFWHVCTWIMNSCICTNACIRIRSLCNRDAYTCVHATCTYMCIHMWNTPYIHVLAQTFIPENRHIHTHAHIIKAGQMLTVGRWSPYALSCLCAHTLDAARLSWQCRCINVYAYVYVCVYVCMCTYVCVCTRHGICLQTSHIQCAYTFTYVYTDTHSC